MSLCLSVDFTFAEAQELDAHRRSSSRRQSVNALDSSQNETTINNVFIDPGHY
jgi:hypothetical protein